MDRASSPHSRLVGGDSLSHPRCPQSLATNWQGQIDVFWQLRRQLQLHCRHWRQHEHWHFWHLPPNNSFKPNLLRSTKAMAERACHGFGSTTQVGLTQALGGARQRSSQRGDRPPSAIATCTPCRPHTPCSLKAAALRLWTNSLVKNSRAHRTRSVQLAQVWLPCPEILGPVSKSSLVSRLTIRSSRVRFAASSRCGKLVHLAAAATLLGLAQALGATRQHGSFSSDRPCSSRNCSSGLLSWHG